MKLHYKIILIIFASWLHAHDNQFKKKNENQLLCIVFPSILRKNNISFLYAQCSKNDRLFRLVHESLGQQKLKEDIKKLTERIHYNQKPFFTFTVKVLLDEKLLTDKVLWSFKSNVGFVIYPLCQPNRHKYYKQQFLKIHTNKEKLFFDGKQVNSDIIMIKSLNGFFEFNNCSYHGSVLLVRNNDRFFLINQLDIEDYIFCVLRWESWPGWPIEVNKAFAIACRSYLIHQVAEAAKSNRVYHIKNTNIHQTYKGIHNNKELRKAINQTRGLILTYNQKPIVAMFDCCCGGIIPAHLSYIDFNKAPYLARTYQCNFCQPSKIYSWQLKYSLQDFELLLKNAGYPLSEIKHIAVSANDMAGSVQEVVIHDKATSLKLTGKQMYSLLEKVKSFCYSIEKKGKDIYFNGKGYGHHVGICQWGARRMIDLGWNYRSILAFYYPGTKLMELKNTI
ncbi:MAG: SpoIID/LytB domain-containing protein [Candidatus Babeliales bacterium]